MRDNDIDDVLKRAAGASPDVDPALLERISQSIAPTLRPVRPMAPMRLLVAALVLICAGMALAAAATLGMHGIQKMNAVETSAIFPLLAVLLAISAAVSAGEMVPGSRRLLAPPMLLAVLCAAMAAVFALLFQDYRSERFVAQGIPCLITGLALAAPVSMVCWFVLRRGFAVDRAAAGIARGALAGLAGLAVLELHCPNFELAHVVVWHIAVPLLSGLAGGVLFGISRRGR